MFPSEIPKLPTDPLVRGFPGVRKLLHGSLPRPVSIPNSFVSLFIFYILSYLLSKRMDCLSGCLVSSTSVRKLFCGSCSAFKWPFDDFMREKMVSLSYSSILPFQVPPSTRRPFLTLQIIYHHYFSPSSSSIFVIFSVPLIWFLSSIIIQHKVIFENAWSSLQHSWSS